MVVGLEIKRELIDGELKTLRRAMFPLAAAVGGMLVPAMMFSFFNPYQPQNSGWAVPMATDIAIAAGVLALLGRSVPRSLRVFLLSLAIIDDIGSIAVIGIFYSQPTNTFALLIAVLFGLGLFMVRKRRYWPIAMLALGAGLWYCLLLAGVSGTLAGIAIALAMPLTARRANASRLQTAETIEDVLIPVTSFVIVPLFVLANAGLRFSGISLATGDGRSVFIGVVCGLLLGKPIGILLASWLANVFKLAHKPKNITWMHIAGVGILAGTGFTVSLLVTGLAYENNAALQNAAIIGIFTASVAASFIGLLVLRQTSQKNRA